MKVKFILIKCNQIQWQHDLDPSMTVYTQWTCKTFSTDQCDYASHNDISNRLHLLCDQRALKNKYTGIGCKKKKNAIQLQVLDCSSLKDPIRRLKNMCKPYNSSHF